MIAAPAGAAPAPGPRASATLTDQARQVELLDEQYNQAQIRADQLAADARVLGDRVAQADRDVDVARGRLADVALQSYVHSGAASLLGALINAHVDDIAARRVYVRTAVAAQSSALKRMQAASRRLDALHTRLRANAAAARATTQTIAETRSRAQAMIQSLQAALGQSPGASGGIAASQPSPGEQRATQARFGVGPSGAPSTATTTSTIVAAPLGPSPGTTARPPTTTIPRGPTPPPVTTAPHITTPPTTQAPTAPKPAAPVSPPPPVAPGAATAVATAKAQLGKPYEWGAAGPNSFDCSGLTMYAWRAAGVVLPHSAAMQYQAIPQVAIADLQPGDLVFFGNPIYHVGMYVGGGQMIYAPHTGANVQYGSIWWPDLVGAARP